MSETLSTPQSLTRPWNGTDVPAAGAYRLDVSHTEVGFSVRHLMVSKTRGRFGDFDGTVVIAEDPTESSLEVSVRLASVDTRDETRDGHLRTPDFFDVENYPEMTFRSTAVRHIGGDRWAVDGTLTVKGVSRPLTLDTTFEGTSGDPWGGTRTGFSAKGEIDREAFGLTWNAALETGGVVVGKKVTIEIEAEAILQ